MENYIPPDTTGHNTEAAKNVKPAVSAWTTSSGVTGETTLTTLLTGLMHYCDRAGQDFNAVLKQAREDYQIQITPEFRPGEEMWICGKVNCGWRGRKSDLLDIPDSPGSRCTRGACPKCKQTKNGFVTKKAT